ncbi:MAG: TIGR01212 family radical SAM protein [Candidatus Sumerlaeia bacterium]|nr:TIGR01212 family radical SAM protein [Candidatus Sumerlaeia bacterium]
MSDNLRYNSFSRHLREKFGCRVHRVAVDAGFTCPVRNGTKGKEGCLYCDEAGARAAYCEPQLSIREQVQQGIAMMRHRFKAEKFIVYFQPYTNTYAPVDKLREVYDSALNVDENIIGLAIGTRPDCVSDEVLDLLALYNTKYYLWLEYGLQSASNETLKRINRGHSVEDFVNAVQRTHQRGIRVCAHVILGLPEEKREEMLASADLINQLKIEGVKIHSLYISRGAPLAKLYQEGKIKLLTLEEYIQVVCDYLEYLSPEVLIHRLVGEARIGDLIAPLWCGNKTRVLNLINAELTKRNSFQGRKFLSH